MFETSENSGRPNVKITASTEVEAKYR